MATTLEINNEKRAATEDMVDSVRDLMSAKITIPLGNPALKFVHTNQFLFLNLPDEFQVANMEVISKYINSQYNRYVPYKKNRWYIEGSNIINDGDKFEMELEVNPFPSTLRQYRDNKLGYIKSYKSAKEKQEEEKRKAEEEKKKAEEEAKKKAEEEKKKEEESKKEIEVKSVPKTNTTLKGGQGSTIDNLVKNWVGMETNELKKAILIHNGLKAAGIKYAWYRNFYYGNATNCWKNKNHLNCGDTAKLTTACMRSGGLNAFVALRCDREHFFTVIKIGGKQYFSDLTGATGRNSTRAWNTVWQNNKNWCTNYGAGG